MKKKNFPLGRVDAHAQRVAEEAAETPILPKRPKNPQAGEMWFTGTGANLKISVYDGTSEKFIQLRV